MRIITQRDFDQYTFGDCNIFAIALSRITKNDMLVIAKNVINEEEEADDDSYYEYECAHAALLVDDITLLDIRGISLIEDAAKKCLWNFDDSKYHGNYFIKKFKYDECEDISSYFASYDEELIEDAISLIKESNFLSIFLK